MEILNGKLWDELPSREVFNSLLEAQALIELRRQGYNNIRPHHT